VIHKIKKILEAKIEADSAYYSLIYTFAYRVELFSFLVISVLFFLSLFLNFKLNNDFFTLLSIFFLVTISNVLDFKYFKLKKILFYVFLYSGGLYFITHHFNFILWFYILLLAVAFLEYLTFSIAALIVILLTMYYKFETNQIDGEILAQGNIFALNNINFIYIFSIVGLVSIYIVNRFSLSFKEMIEENEQKNLKKIQDTVQSMTNLLEDVIRIGKTENQFAQVSYNKYDIIKLIDEILTEIKFIEKIPHYYEFAKDYQGLIISSDEKLQSHIIRNLIHNASKYSEKGTLIKVNIYLLEDNLNIIISDQGIGIPEDDLKHLFEPFFRSGNVGAREGTGLGLSLTKRHVEALGGTIEVESVENQGTTFKLVFPVTYFEILNEENDKS
jgi:signal transduction histidine kinase